MNDRRVISRRTIAAKSFAIHTIRGYISNIFLAVYPEGMIVFDPGVSGDVPLLERYCRETLDRPVTDIRLSIVSHMHPDHAGGAVSLREKYGIPIAANPRADLWYAGITGYVQYALDCVMTLWVGLRVRRRLRNIWFPRIIRPEVPLGESGPRELLDGWQPVSIPGHTMHDMAFFHPGERILYAADSVICVRGKYAPPIPVHYRELMRQSYRRLAALPARMILMAHGETIEDADSGAFFTPLIERLDAKKPLIARLAALFSFYSPEIWKAFLRKHFSQRQIY